VVSILLASYLSDSQLAAIERLSAALVDSVSLRPLPLAHRGKAAVMAWCKDDKQ